jgi:hypothetical protein
MYAPLSDSARCLGFTIQQVSTCQWSWDWCFWGELRSPFSCVVCQRARARTSSVTSLAAGPLCVGGDDVCCAPSVAAVAPAAGANVQRPTRTLRPRCVEWRASRAMHEATAQHARRRWHDVMMWTACQRRRRRPGLAAAGGRSGGLLCRSSILVRSHVRQDLLCSLHSTTYNGEGPRYAAREAIRHTAGRQRTAVSCG